MPAATASTSRAGAGSSPSAAPTSWPTTSWCSCAARPGAASSTATPRSSACAASTSCSRPATPSPSCARSRPPRDARRSRSRSASATSSADLGTAYRQAVACTRLAPLGGVLHAERLGPLRFILDAPDLSQVRAVVNEQLGPLLAYEGGRSDLVATLRAFVAADGNVAETAKACFIHKNTLRYRLTRLTDVLGRDPATPDVKFHLRMAFDLVDLFAGLGIDLLPAQAPGATGR